MHAIEFETISHHHTITLPNNVPDGVPLRVLLLSQTPLVNPVASNLKALLCSVAEGITAEDFARPQDYGREAPEWAS
ncbi:MAG: hypothetical protein ACOH1I_06135 [Gallionellaceae bacterium]|jgi:hypothetical protein